MDPEGSNLQTSVHAILQLAGANGTSGNWSFSAILMLKWGMERPNAVAALKDKRSEIAGRVDALQDQLRQALIDLDHVDSTILLFDPDAELDEIKAKPMPPRHHAFRGR